MRYVSWASFYEGPSDALYFDVVIPRLIREIVGSVGLDIVEVPDAPAVKLGLKHREIDQVADEACYFKDAYDMLFVHADAGGRGQELNLAARSDAYCTAVQARCDWKAEQCVTITPRHEMEAWLLADANAVIGALGFNGAPEELGLPATAQEAEQAVDPKQLLSQAINAVAGRRRRPRIENIFPAIAQRQELAVLRHSQSFARFENRLSECLRVLRLIS